jgi:hypothetical protein
MVRSCSENAVTIAVMDAVVFARACPSWPRLRMTGSDVRAHSSRAETAVHDQQHREPDYQLRKVTKNRDHFPGDDAAVKLLRLAIVNIEDKRARESSRRREETGKRRDQPARLIEGQRAMGWCEALNELGTAYPGRIK